jgi:hypothetical protein
MIALPEDDIATKQDGGLRYAIAFGGGGARGI